MRVKKRIETLQKYEYEIKTLREDINNHLSQIMKMIQQIQNCHL
jgi:hypothetical protein